MAAWLYAGQVFASGPEQPAGGRVGELIRRIETGTWEERADAASEIEKLDRTALAALPALESAMGAAERPVRMCAARAMGRLARFDPAAVIPMLVRGLRDPARATAAAWGLANAGSIARPAVPEMAAVLLDDEARVLTTEILFSLGCLGEIASEAAPVVATLLSSDDVNLRSDAAMALGKMKSREPGVLKTLRARLTDDDPSVAALAAFALWQVDAVNDGQVVSLFRSALTRIDVYALALLQAISVLGRSAAELLPMVLPLAEHQSSFVRYYAIEAIGKMGVTSEPVLAAISRALVDRAPPAAVYGAAVDALGSLGKAAAPAVPSMLAAITVVPDMEAPIRKTIAGWGVAALGYLQAVSNDVSQPQETRRIAAEITSAIRQQER